MKFIYLVSQERNCPCGESDGVAGDARTILNGTGAPNNTLGKDGDYYIDNSNTYLYGPKTGGAWSSFVPLRGPQGVQGPQGTQGPSGKTIISGSGAPNNTLGTDGDLYLDTTNSILYGPLAGGTWGTGKSLVGPQGVQGIQGPQGVQGTQGNPGPPGTVSATSGLILNPTTPPTTTFGENAVFIDSADDRLKRREPNNGNIGAIAETTKDQQYTRTQGVATVPLTDSATVTADCSLSNKFSVTLGGNRTLSVSNLRDATYIFRIRQDGTGGRSLSYGSMFKFPGGNVPVLSSAANALDTLTCESDGTNLYCALLKDFK